MLTRRSLLANAASVAAVGAISPALMSQALAQTVAPAYPDRPIRIIVGYAAGGGVDIVARLLSEPMKQAFGNALRILPCIAPYWPRWLSSTSTNMFSLVLRS